MSIINARMSSFYLPFRSVDVIGLSGKAGSGKTYIAKVLHRSRGYVPLALADHFKVDCIARHGAPAEEVYGSSKSPDLRKLLQEAGTEKGRDVCGVDIWLRTLEAHMYGMWKAGVEKFVVTDIRFPNEVDWIHAMGGKVYRIIGRGGENAEAAMHRSEIALDEYQGFDGYIDNSPNSDLAMELYLKLDAQTPH